jgi:hypothetical protein
MFSPLSWGLMLLANKSTYSEGSLTIIIIMKGIPINQANIDLLKYKPSKIAANANISIVQKFRAAITTHNVYTFLL